MNNSEAVKLFRLVKAFCPAEQFDEHTPDAWAIVMNDIRYDDAQIAVRTLYRDRGNDQEWGGRKIEADDIIREVRRIRAERVARHPEIDPPPGLTDLQYLDWLRATRKAIADGQTITQPALPARDISQLTAINKRPA